MKSLPRSVPFSSARQLQLELINDFGQRICDTVEADEGFDVSKVIHGLQWLLDQLSWAYLQRMLTEIQFFCKKTYTQIHTACTYTQIHI